MRNRISGTGRRLTAALVTAVLALGAAAYGGGSHAGGQSTADAQPDDSGGKPGSAYGSGSTADFEPSDIGEGSQGPDAIPIGGGSTADPQ
jgi:hypothetical protein